MEVRAKCSVLRRTTYSWNPLRYSSAMNAHPVHCLRVARSMLLPRPLLPGSPSVMPMQHASAYTTKQYKYSRNKCSVFRATKKDPVISNKLIIECTPRIVEPVNLTREISNGSSKAALPVMARPALSIGCLAVLKPCYHSTGTNSSVPPAVAHLLRIRGHTA